LLQDVAYGPEWAAEMKKFDELLAVWMPAQLEKIVEGFQGEQHKSSVQILQLGVLDFGGSFR
jgi:hypothetical protein